MMDLVSTATRLRRAHPRRPVDELIDELCVMIKADAGDISSYSETQWDAAL